MKMIYNKYELTPDEQYIKKLEIENERLRKESGDRACLAARMADASDRMKLQLILSGVLSIPQPKQTVFCEWMEF